MDRSFVQIRTYLCRWHLAIHTATYTFCSAIAVCTGEAGVQKTERSGFGLSFPCSSWGCAGWYQLGRGCIYLSLIISFRGTLSSSTRCWFYLHDCCIRGAWCNETLSFTAVKMLGRGWKSQLSSLVTNSIWRNLYYFYCLFLFLPSPFNYAP